jgi:ketosteroid isomerase-like protein
LSQEKSTPKPRPDPGEGELARNPAVDEFLSRLNYDMHRPKPGQESIAAALQAIQRLTLQMDAEHAGEASIAEANACSVCGAINRPGNQFCSSCGVSLAQGQDDEAPAPAPAQPANTQPAALPAGQHFYHHHYHHHYFADGGTSSNVPETRVAGTIPGKEAALGRGPLSGTSLSRAEAAVRKSTQDWALACNTKHLDDLVELYFADAIVMRSNVPAVRGTAAIREFLFSVLDTGFGEVEMEPLRVEIFGEIAYEAGRYKALAPQAMGKRREERGKYLIILARHSGEWKIMADCWSSDLSLAENSLPPAVKSRKNP